MTTVTLDSQARRRGWEDTFAIVWGYRAHRASGLRLSETTCSALRTSPKRRDRLDHPETVPGGTVSLPATRFWRVAGAVAGLQLSSALVQVIFAVSVVACPLGEPVSSPTR